MKNGIKDHYREEDIQKMKLESDIENWEATIDFAEKEIDFFTKLLNLPQLNIKNSVGNGSFTLIDQLQTIAETNKVCANELVEFRNKIEGLNECEDLQCETFFLNSHEDFRSKIEKHLLRFRALKGRIFPYITKDII